MVLIAFTIYVTVYRKTRHNAASSVFDYEHFCH